MLTHTNPRRPNDICSAGVCTAGAARDCDDGDACTVDSCLPATGCVHQGGAAAATCSWAVIGGDATAGSGVSVWAHGGTTIDGNVCGDRLGIGRNSTTSGSWACTAAAPARGRVAVGVGRGATISGDLATAGTGVRGRPTGSEILGTGVSMVTGGSTVDIPAGGTIDTTGASPLVGRCESSRNEIAAWSAQLDSLPSTQTQTVVKVFEHDSLTLAASVVGGLNVIDFTRLKLANDTTLTLDGGGSPDTVFVLRFSESFDTDRGVTIDLANGTSPNNVVFYSKGEGKCEIGKKNSGGGTVLCTASALKVKYDTVWNGAWMAQRRHVDIGSGSRLTHAAFTGALN